jgi:hypothetical protein
MKKWKSGIVGGVAGLLTISGAFASVPKHVTNDTALYQNLSEIRAQRQKELNFDRDIAQLASSESRYREKLPVSSNARVSSPMKRISAQKYQYSKKRPTRAQQ